MKKYSAFIAGEIKTLPADDKTKAFLAFCKIDDSITLGEIWEDGQFPKKWQATYVENGHIIRVKEIAMTKVIAWRKIGVGKVSLSDITRIY